jgi:2-hydroxy-4-carboxymuconate semialdehyde hemiacetal dehydrogenase
LRIAVVGAGAFGEKHLDALKNIPHAEVKVVVSVSVEEARKVADKFGIAEVSDSYEEVLKRDDIDAVILTTPTPMHAAQAIAAMKAGKHVEVEIPVADSGPMPEVLRVQQETGKVCMVGHTRRFNPSHQWVKHKIDAGEFNILAMDIETFFFRRKNINAKGEPRSWTDHLLWHHSAHSIDIFQYMTGAKVVKANILQGPSIPSWALRSTSRSSSRPTRARS